MVTKLSWVNPWSVIFCQALIVTSYFSICILYVGISIWVVFGLAFLTSFAGGLAWILLVVKVMGLGIAQETKSFLLNGLFLASDFGIIFATGAGSVIDNTVFAL